MSFDGGTTRIVGTMSAAVGTVSSRQAICDVESSAARNYSPLPVVISSGSGSWVTDPEGRRYLDLLAGYSALNFGHRHPDLIAAAHRQLDRVTLTSRAFHNDVLGQFCRELVELCQLDLALPMNTGAEAVETAIKTARKWGHLVKGVPQDRAEIIVMDGNFHGRTTTIISFSDDPDARADFGPFTPGFVSVPYGDAAALAAAVTDNTVAILLEPIQGEAGVRIPPTGFLAETRQLCDQHGILMVADEIQAGLGRTGTTFACDYEHVRPDIYVLGKALGGGIVALSAVVSSRAILGVFKPGEHGSTFGGNPLACAIGLEVVRLLREGDLQRRTTALGAVMSDLLADLPPELVTQWRSRGLWAGVDLAERSGREVCESLARRGVLAKETHGSTIRLAPPLTITEDDLRWGLTQLRDELTDGQR